MKSVVQRVAKASLSVGGKVTSQIKKGVFGADVTIIQENIGPVTIIYETKP